MNKPLWDLDLVKTTMSRELLSIAGSPLSLAKLLVCVAVLVGMFVGSRYAQAAIARALRYRGVVDEGNLGVVKKIVHYVVILIGVSSLFETVGIDLSAIFAAGTVFAVGIGFAMQSMAQNFVSGLVLLVERSIKPHDVLNIDSTIVRVQEMKIRATIVTTRDGESLVVPNSALIQSTVKNYSKNSGQFRVRVPVGVEYGSDMKVVWAALRSVADEMNAKLGPDSRRPLVVMTEFADSAVVYELYVWIRSAWDEKTAISEIMDAVWWKFKQVDVKIAFPQLDVHFDSGPTSQNLELPFGG